jgi:hypothetical protein
MVLFVVCLIGGEVFGKRIHTNTLSSISVFGGTYTSRSEGINIRDLGKSKIHVIVSNMKDTVVDIKIYSSSRTYLEKKRLWQNTSFTIELEEHGSQNDVRYIDGHGDAGILTIYSRISEANTASFLGTIKGSVSVDTW